MTNDSRLDDLALLFSFSSLGSRSLFLSFSLFFFSYVFSSSPSSPLFSSHAGVHFTSSSLSTLLLQLRAITSLERTEAFTSQHVKTYRPLYLVMSEGISSSLVNLVYLLGSGHGASLFVEVITDESVSVGREGPEMGKRGVGNGARFNMKIMRKSSVLPPSSDGATSSFSSSTCSEVDKKHEDEGEDDGDSSLTALLSGSSSSSSALAGLAAAQVVARVDAVRTANSAYFYGDTR